MDRDKIFKESMRKAERDFLKSLSISPKDNQPSMEEVGQVINTAYRALFNTYKKALEGKTSEEMIRYCEEDIASSMARLSKEDPRIPQEAIAQTQEIVYSAYLKAALSLPGKEPKRFVRYITHKLKDLEKLI